VATTSEAPVRSESTAQHPIISAPGWDAQAAGSAPTIPDYELLRPIGRGAYGEVWLARNVTGSFVAVKVVSRGAFDHDRPFEREFEGIKSFEPISRSHPSQLAILHVGHNDQAGCFYYVMELADPASGPRDETLHPAEKQSRVATPCTAKPFLDSSSKSRVSSSVPSNSGILQPDSYVPHTLRHDLRVHGRLPVDQVIELGLTLAEGLSHLHAHGLVHRDIKPSNIVFVKGKPKLADIGLVTSAGDERSIIGTEGYLAPESPGKPQGDIYSLGKVLYEAAMGRDRRDFPDLPEDWQSLPDRARLLELNEILLRACAADLQERYQSAEEMGSELALLQRGGSVVRKRNFGRLRSLAWKLAVAATGLTLLAIAVKSGFWRANGTRALSSNSDALRLYQAAVYESQGSAPERLLQAFIDLTNAVGLDPKFADAYFKLYDLNFGVGDQLPPYTNAMANLRFWRDKLAALSTNSVQYHTANAGIEFLDWHFKQALDEMELVRRLDPTFRAHGFYGWMILRARGDAAGARREWETVLSLDGAEVVAQTMIGTVDYFERDFTNAIRHFKRALELEDRTTTAYEMLGRVYEANQQYDLAFTQWETMEKLERPQDAIDIEKKYVRYRATLHSKGTDAMWQAILDDVWNSQKPDPFFLAKFYARLGQKEDAIYWLEQARLDHDNNILMLLIDDWWDPLRDEPDFKQLLREVGFLNLDGPAPRR
jgi:tetratricopeptide (TPR) repeat protein